MTKKNKMTEDQYQLGIRKLSPHQMVTLIVRYRGVVREAASLCKKLLDSDTCFLNAIQKELLKVSIANYNEYVEDYTTLLDDEED